MQAIAAPIYIYNVSKKQYAWILVGRFSKFFRWQIPNETLCNYYRVFYLTLTMLLHYLKLNNI